MKNFFKKSWEWLNGNKSLIFGALFSFCQLKFAENHIPPETLEVAKWATGILAGGGLAHHAYKGYFSTKVGNPGQQPSPTNLPKTLSALKSIFLKDKGK